LQLPKAAKTRVCPACGFQPEAKPDVETEDGELHELTKDKKQKVRDWPLDRKVNFYRELLLHAKLRGYKSGWAYWAYKDKFGSGPPRGFGDMPAQMIGPETEAWIKHYNIKKAKRRDNKRVA